MNIREFNIKTEIVRSDNCISVAVKTVGQFRHALDFTDYNNMIVFTQDSFFTDGVIGILKILREKLDNDKYKYDICDVGATNKAVIIYKIKN